MGEDGQWPYWGVDSVGEALAHIAKYSTGHTEAIVTNDLANSERFVAEVESAAVMVNASTRFTDGGQLGTMASVWPVEYLAI